MTPLLSFKPSLLKKPSEKGVGIFFTACGGRAKAEKEKKGG